MTMWIDENEDGELTFCSNTDFEVTNDGERVEIKLTETDDSKDWNPLKTTHAGEEAKRVFVKALVKLSNY